MSPFYCGGFTKSYSYHITQMEKQKQYDESDFGKKLTNWISAGSNWEDRKRAAESIKAVYWSGKNKVELCNYVISELPPLPSSVTELWIVGCSLKFISCDLPFVTTLRIVSSPELQIVSGWLKKGEAALNLEAFDCRNLREIFKGVDASEFHFMRFRHCPVLTHVPENCDRTTQRRLLRDNCPNIKFF